MSMTKTFPFKKYPACMAALVLTVSLLTACGGKDYTHDFDY